jgi:hypothetical protein
MKYPFTASTSQGEKYHAVVGPRDMKWLDGHGYRTVCGILVNGNTIFRQPRFSVVRKPGNCRRCTGLVFNGVEAGTVQGTDDA